MVNTLFDSSFYMLCVCAYNNNNNSNNCTPNMEECEALCSRVSIFVNGRIKCLGTCQHLKTRFGHGYSLHIQVMIPTVNTTGLSVNTNSQSSIVSTTSTSILRSRNSTAGVEKSMELNQTAPPPPPTTTTELMIEAVENVSNFIRREFPDARLVDQHQGVLQYHLPTDEHNQICLSRLFHLMETNKAHLGLVNYSISQTTLEQIFIDLTKLQEEPPVSPVVVGQQ
ncbi:unnamed protein product [Trichobilharzia regenti]|nr:unnamed protein product [Trichobilharzia regenti]